MSIRILVLLFFSGIVCADGTGKIYPYKPTKNAEVIRNNDRPGMLLAHPTFHLDDGLNRPCCWNGYGVDPEGANYYHYFDKQPCRYDFMSDLCKEDEDDEEEGAQVPTPSSGKMISLGVIMLAVYRFFGRKQI